MIGTVLGGRYTILEEVGKGGMAHVYKAQCNVLNRLVAVKMLRTDLEGGDDFIERFNAEAQAAACLTHPNIVSIYDVGEENGLYYIVMEYIDGITLKEYIKSKGKLSSTESAEIASQICSALTIAHEKNIVHRDIKPHNIMITKDNLIKVTDFGIARASNSATVQVGESILGSVHYISPEQARGGYIDGRTDIYSLGIVLYEMLTGKVPFESESPIAIAMKHIEETPVLPTEIVPEISLELQDVVLKAISKETRKRYQNVTAMKSDLDVVVNLLKTLSGDVVSSSDEEIASDNKFQDTINISIAEVKAQKDVSAEVSDELSDVKINVNSNDNVVSDNQNSGNNINDNEYSDNNDANNEPEHYDEDDEDDEEPRRTVGMSVNLILTAIIIALFVVGGASLVIGYYVFPDAKIYTIFNDVFGENDVKIPNVVGMQINEAKSHVANFDLKIEVIESEYGPQIEGIITKQDKAVGNTVKKGAVIKVHTSRGPDEEYFKKLIGKNADRQKEIYVKKGYNIELTYEPSSAVEKGEIFDVHVVGNKVYFYVDDGGENTSKNSNKSDDDSDDEKKDEEDSEDKDDEDDKKNEDDKKDDESKKEDDTTNNTSDEPQKKQKTMDIHVSSFKKGDTIKVVDPSGNVVYEGVLDPENEPELHIVVENTGTVTYSIYIEGNWVAEYHMNFNR